MAYAPHRVKGLSKKVKQQIYGLTFQNYAIFSHSYPASYKCGMPSQLVWLSRGDLPNKP